MTTGNTALLGLAIPVTGELSGSWGDTINNQITSLLDSAVAGTTTLSTDADVTLTSVALAANQARQAILLCTGARTAIRTITAPAQSKLYVVINATTGGYAVKLVGAGPTTGVSVAPGASILVAWNGSDFAVVGEVTLTGTQTLTNKTYTGVKETKIAIAASDIDLTLGNWYTRTISGTTTLTVSNVPAAGTAACFILELTNGGSATVNWWSGMKWAGGAAPVLTTAGRDVLGFFTYDGGTTWTGVVIGKDFL